ncbi:hypothetical protein SAMN06269185_0265 [Natronoarchaeum philippinense]|uniref:6-hydroxymethyl-7,8-dihydropterin pyrophosphokinase n=1 Tax=Natronoarchaeum philippinense TaxID=558529 RepID=A0A285N1P8_NATPI|nr:6-hydroxymethylpterin diphosphokinase MptE-like protein [Natronoarchaeum philippinense]SNZ03394.1 hypothetical protein SAMN06269185_0265 [Natronoarchaeum philippinense]
MNESDWCPIYESILQAFGFDSGADEQARDVLAELSGPFDLDLLADIDGATVAIAGAGPSLDAEVEVAREADAVVAASTAARVLGERGVEIDLMVTDLDGAPETAVELSRAGTPVTVHAHGDNTDALREYVPQFDGDYLLPTTQAESVDHVRNFGGFTDGDRAAFLADELGAARLTFLGWDFDDPAVDPMKAEKLRWAGRLLYRLERDRGERFDVLDGRREEIEPV